MSESELTFLAYVAAFGVLMFLLWLVVRVIRHAWKGSEKDSELIEIRLATFQAGLIGLTAELKRLREDLEELQRRLGLD